MIPFSPSITWQKECETIPAAKFNNALKNCRGRISQWRSCNTNNSRQAIEALKKHIQQAYEQNPIPIEDIKALENELAFQYRMDEEFWRMKSRIQWLQAGDKNTKFFHEKCKQRRNYNRITSIAERSGRIHFKLDDVKKIISDFYESLYTSKHMLEEWPQLPEILKKVTPEINAKLTKPITDNCGSQIPQ